MSSLIIGLIGERFAGKDEAADYLVQKHDAAHIKYSHVLDEILEELDLPITRRNEIDLGMALRKTFGENVLWGGMLKRIKQTWAGIVVINGIRFENEFKNVKDMGGKIIYITAPQNLLFERSKQRKEKEDDGEISMENFIKLENEATEIGIPDLGKKADYKIENLGKIEDLTNQISKILKQIIP